MKTPQGYYVMKVLERAPPDPADSPRRRTRSRKEVLTQKQSQAWQAWVERARAGAKVETAQKPPAPRRNS